MILVPKVVSSKKFEIVKVHSLSSETKVNSSPIVQLYFSLKNFGKYISPSLGIFIISPFSNLLLNISGS